MTDAHAFRTPASAEALHYERSIERIADHLEKLAQRVRREGGRASLDLDGSHVRAAHAVLHEVMWGVANANLDTLVAAAGKVDEAKHTACAEPAATNITGADR